VERLPHKGQRGQENEDTSGFEPLGQPQGRERLARATGHDRGDPVVFLQTLEYRVDSLGLVRSRLPLLDLDWLPAKPRVDGIEIISCQPVEVGTANADEVAPIRDDVEDFVAVREEYLEISTVGETNELRQFGPSLRLAASSELDLIGGVVVPQCPVDAIDTHVGWGQHEVLHDVHRNRAIGPHDVSLVDLLGVEVSLGEHLEGITAFLECRQGLDARSSSAKSAKPEKRPIALNRRADLCCGADVSLSSIIGIFANRTAIVDTDGAYSTLESRYFMNDLERLGDYLSSEESPEDTMLLSDLDGFLHGIACSPVEVPAQEWMQAALGVSPEEVPQWVLETIGSRFMSILEGLAAEPPVMEPVFWQANEGHVIAMDWCEGFMEAVDLRQDAWQEFTNTNEGAKLMLPILVHMIDEEGNSMFGIPQEELDETLEKSAEAIPMAVPFIFDALAPRRLISTERH
jgi:uncharacterized protein